MSESHVWLYTKPAGCWEMGQQRTITLMLNPNRAFWDLCWETEANPASPDQGHRWWNFYSETGRGDDDRVWGPSEASLVEARELVEQEETVLGDRRRLSHMFRSEQHARHVHKHKPRRLMQSKLLQMYSSGEERVYTGRNVWKSCVCVNT